MSPSPSPTSFQNRLASSSASSLDRTSSSAKLTITSLDSVNGPSVSVMFPSDATTCVPRGQRAGDGNGFACGTLVPADQVVVRADLMLLHRPEASGEVIPLGLLRQGSELDRWPAAAAGEEIPPVLLVDQAAQSDL